MIKQRRLRVTFSSILLVCMVSMLSGELAAQQSTKRGLAELQSLSPNSKTFYKGDIQTKISVNFSGVRLKQALQQIAQKGHLKLTYRGDIMVQKKVTLHKKNITVSAALDQILKSTPLEYRVSKDRYLLIIPKEINLKKADPTVSGTVTDAQTGMPLSGANIFVVSTTMGALTDSVGHYSVEVPSLQDTLRFSYIGYKTKTVPIKGQTVINIDLKPKVISGKEMVVTAYGEERNKISVVGAVQTIKSPSKTLKIPSSSLTNAFAGRMAGVISFQRSGQPGRNASKFYIRGIPTFSGSTQPLIIVDGVKVSSSYLNTLAPESIKSFSILKDATATAVYGSRGGNGVMVIKTKTGKNLAHPKVRVRLENSVQSPVNKPQFVDGVSFMKLYNEAVKTRNTGESLYSKSKIENTGVGKNKYLYPNVDWYNMLFKKISTQQKANVNILGGGKRVQYFMGGTFTRNNGMLKSFDLFDYDNNFHENRLSFVGNLDIDATPTTHVALKLNTNLIFRHGPAATTGNIFKQIYNGNPVDFPVMFPRGAAPDAKGRVLFGGQGGNTRVKNPFAEMVTGYRDKFRNKSIVNIQLEQDLSSFIENLSFKGMAAFYSVGRVKTERSRPYNTYYIFSTNPSSGSSYPFTLERVNSKARDLTLRVNNHHSGYRRIYLQGRLKYKKQLTNKQQLSAMVLYNQMDRQDNEPSGLISSLPQRTMGVAGRINYNYNETYLAEFNFGYNGSANFAKGHRFGFFPSFGIGYVISNENFWKPIKNTVNLLKLTASWGKVGNKDIGADRYVYQSKVDLNGNCYQTGVNKGYRRCGASFERFANPKIRWEIGKKVNIGLKLGLFHNLDLTVNVFRQKRNGIFLKRNTIPNDFGTVGTKIYGNLGRVTNKGMDVQINYSKSFSKDFFMSFKGVFTFARNEITAKDTPPQIPKNLSPMGHPIGTHFGYIDKGLFKDKKDVNQSPDQRVGGVTMPGDIKYKDLNGDGKITAKDRKQIGYPNVPEMTYGFGPSFKYKKFDFSFLIEGVARVSFFMKNFKPFKLPASEANNVRNVLKFIKDSHWTEENRNTHARFPRLNTNNNANNYVNSTFWLRDGSYIQLKYAELGYTFNRTIRLYLSGRRLIKWSNFKIWDPELGGGNGAVYPLQRTVNIGVQFKL